jgi:hypothetical protein
MRLQAARQYGIRHLAAAFAFGLAALGAGFSAHAEDAPPAAAPVIGKTTLAEAREMWQTSGATVASEGHLAIGGGRGRDGLSTVGLEQVLLVTVDGVEFEGLPAARYAFVDDVLYAVSAQLHNGNISKMVFKDLNKDDMAQLEQTLRRKYGKPQGFNDLLIGSKPNILVWNLKNEELTLTLGGISGFHLTRQNKALAKKVDAYTKAECKNHRIKGPGNITDVCV